MTGEEEEESVNSEEEEEVALEERDNLYDAKAAAEDSDKVFDENTSITLLSTL